MTYREKMLELTTLFIVRYANLHLITRPYNGETSVSNVISVTDLHPGERYEFEIYLEEATRTIKEADEAKRKQELKDKEERRRVRNRLRAQLLQRLTAEERELLGFTEDGKKLKMENI